MHINHDCFNECSSLTATAIRRYTYIFSFFEGEGDGDGGMGREASYHSWIYGLKMDIYILYKCQAKNTVHWWGSCC